MPVTRRAVKVFGRFRCPSSGKCPKFGAQPRLRPGSGEFGVLQHNTDDGFDHMVKHQQRNPSGSLDVTDYAYDLLNRKTSQTTGVGTNAPQTTSYAYIGWLKTLSTPATPR